MHQFPPFISPSCSLSWFLPVWHFQSAQYPLTEYPLTFVWLDTFSSGREFIINLHLIGPFVFKAFLRADKVTRANGKVRLILSTILHIIRECVGANPSGKSRKESHPSQSGESCFSLKSWVALTPATSSSVFRSFFASFQLNSSQGNGIFNVSKSPPLWQSFFQPVLLCSFTFSFPLLILMCYLMLLFSNSGELAKYINAWLLKPFYYISRLGTSQKFRY